MKVKKVITFLFYILFNTWGFSQVLNDGQVFKSGHWIYSALRELENEQKIMGFMEVQPVSAGEIKFYFSQFDYDKLSSRGKMIWEKTSLFLNENSSFLGELGLKLASDVIFNPEFYYKNNEKVDWSFKYRYKDDFLIVPVLTGFGNNIASEADFNFGMDYYAQQNPHNFTNITFLQSFFYDYWITKNESFPEFAYISGSKAFNGWGISSNLGRSGLNYLDTLGGSIFYSNSFETDFYWQLNLFSPWFRFSSDVAQCGPEKYIYIHHIAARPFKNLKIGMMEGGLLNSPFELRFLNPAILVHSFHARTNYGDNYPYPDKNYASYFGWYIEYVPVSNFRTYFMLAQDELQLNEETKGKWFLIPDGIALQLGAEYMLHLGEDDGLKFQAESVYTFPYMYIKSQPEISFYSHRKNAFQDNYVDSWIGSPYGPDCFAAEACITYCGGSKWNAGFDYKFVTHGVNDFSLFDNKDSEGHYIYFPFVQHELGTDYDEALAQARGFWLKGIVEYRNEFTIRGEYKFNDHISAGGKVSYAFILNNNNLQGQTEHCFETAVFGTFTLFNGKYWWKKEAVSE